MLIHVNREALSNAIGHVSKAVSSKTTMPILTGIKLVAEPEELILSASNSDISIQCEIPAQIEDQEYVKIEKTGQVVLPSRYFSDIIRKLPSDEITLTVNEQCNILIQSGHSEFNLNGMDAGEFPQLPQIDQDQAFSIPSELLKSMIRQTVFAVSTSETRPILTGILWILEEGRLKFVATDSHRLVTREVMVEANREIEFSNIVVPGKSLNELAKILEDDDRLIDIIVTENQILVSSKHIRFYSRLLDGTYPDTSRIIPQSNKTEIILQNKDFLQSIERASLLAREQKDNVVKLSLNDEGFIELTSRNSEIGHVNEKVSINSVQGEELKISFNAKYMIDALRSIDSSEIKVHFTGAMSPFVIRPTDHDWTLHLILPVRTYE